MKLANLIYFVFVFVKAKADDSSETLSDCPSVKPLENFDTKSIFEGRWYYLKSTCRDSISGTCTYIDFNNEADDEYEIFYSTEYNAISVHNVQYWTSTIQGELVLNTTLKTLTTGGMKEIRMFQKVRKNIELYLKIFIFNF